MTSPTIVEVVRDSPAVARVVFRSENGVQILSRSVCDALAEILRELKSNRALRVVVFEGRGRTFLAGADLRELQALSRKTARRYSRRGQRLFERIASLKALSIAAIHGACAGGGCELALACDVRLAAKSARIGLPEVTLGLVPGWGGSARATLLLGPARAQALVLSGRLYSAEEALNLGLVEAVVADERFANAVNEKIAGCLAAAPGAVAAAKRLVSRATARPLKTMLAVEAERFADCYASNEPAEGLAAFLEKRPPAWAADRPGS
jgi:enoyl-CoA hydratase/carnithine racemase